MPASLDIEPVSSCPKLSNKTPEMLVAASVDVRLAAESRLDARVHFSLAGVAGGVRWQLCHMS